MSETMDATEMAEICQEEIKPIVSLDSLDINPLTNVLKFLPVRDIVTAAQVCTTLRAAASEDSVWRSKAIEKYPLETVIPLRHYETFKDLLMDDNCENASLYIPFTDLSSEYKHNRSTYYFECRLLGLQWRRTDHTFRLYFDARGEVDLRNPLESCLGVTVRRPSVNRRVLQRRVSQLTTERREILTELNALTTARDLQQMVARDNLNAKLAVNAASLVKANHNLRSADELRFGDLISVTRPMGHKFLIAKPGHYMGWLDFDSLHQVDRLLDELPATFPSKREALHHGVSLSFCYANPLPVMPHGDLVDYHPATILDIPPGFSVLDGFKKWGRYVAHEQIANEMEEEVDDEQVQRERWQDDILLHDVLTRTEPPWFV